MKKLQFKTNSRHISQLGRELVTDFVTALVELIKNSYDADAYGVKIILDKPNTPQSRIVLIDTGTGMTQSDFENKWMVIGTNNKITEPYTPKGRKKAGKKGIGRFSVERLAEKVQIYSFPEFEPPYRVDINWNSFEEINIPALTQRIGILKDHQESTAAKFICNQLADEKKKIDSQFENLKELYKEDDFVKQIGKLSSNDEEVSAQKIDELLETYIAHTEKKKQGIEKIQNDYNRHYSETQKAYQAKIDFQESELNLYKNLASLGMLTGSFGHETSDIVSRIQTSLLLVNLYLDNGMDINQIKDVVSIVSGDFDRIYAYSNLIVNFLRKRKRTIDSEINLSSALKEVGGFYQTIVKSFDITLNFVCEDTIEYKIKQIDFESIVINMITNAFEQVKGRENRKITVTISQSASHLIIYFEDSGTGVPEGKEKEIFRPFETTKENGIGLGLNIVKDIVEKYHGDISVKRSETMLGAKFIVTLPKGDE